MLEPVSMVMVSPTDIPSVLLTWRMLSPARAGRGQPGVGETEQVEAAGRKLRPSRDLYRREDGLLGWVHGQRPVGNIDALRNPHCRAR